MEEMVEKIVIQLEQQGSKFSLEELKSMKSFVLTCVKKDQSKIESLKQIKKELEQNSIDFLSNPEQVVQGFTSCFYLPYIKLTIQAGEETTDNTTYDLASITKLYTFLLTQELIKKGYFKKEDLISDLDSRFPFLKNYTIENILQMAGTICTKRRITEGKNQEEALSILETTYIEDSDFSKNHYTDIGFIILSKVIERIVSEKEQEERTFSQIMDEFLLQPWNIHETMFYPKEKIYRIVGNGNQDNIAHDPKARILGGAIGSAGLFSTTTGVNQLAKILFTKEEYTKMLGTEIYPITEQNSRGYAGINQKHPLGLDYTFVPNQYANHTFASQGFTGSLFVFDSINQIHNHILVDAIRNQEKTKPVGFMKAFNEYQQQLTQATIKAYILEKYYQKIGYLEEIHIKSKVKSIH